MNKCTLFGEEYSYIVPLLLYRNVNGRVHSRFSNGFNLKFGDSLIFIGNKKNGLLPFGIHLREEDTLHAVSSVNNGDAVTWIEKTQSIDLPGVAIKLENAKCFNNELAALKGTEVFNDSFERFSMELTAVENSTGLDISIREFFTKYTAGETEWQVAESYVIRLMEAAKSDDGRLTEEILRYFLGRGQGLTPSGDDLIVGLLAWDAVCPVLSTTFHEKVSELIEAESITTDVAKEYLRYALKQEYSSTVSEMVNVLSTGNAERFEKVFHDLLGVGHSSGLDTLLGILIGMIIFKN